MWAEPLPEVREGALDLTVLGFKVVMMGSIFSGLGAGVCGCSQCVRLHMLHVIIC